MVGLRWILVCMAGVGLDQGWLGVACGSGGGLGFRA